MRDWASKATLERPTRHALKDNGWTSEEALKGLAANPLAVTQLGFTEVENEKLNLALKQLPIDPDTPGVRISLINTSHRLYVKLTLKLT